MDFSYLPLFNAIINEPYFVRRVIEEGADVNELFDKQTPLHCAILEGNLHAAQTLLDCGADLSPKNAKEPPLYTACAVDIDNNYELCKLLLERGADCNDRDLLGRTIFALALGHQTLKIIKLLLEYGADITAVDKFGKSALHFAARNTQVDVLEFVLDHGFNIECTDGMMHYTALHFAAGNSNSYGCEFLLKRGAKVNRITSKSSTPLTVVLDSDAEDQRTVEVLLEYGANVTKHDLRIAARKIDGIRLALMKHIAKMDSSNPSANENHRKFIEKLSCYRGYYRACLQELENMKQVRFYRNVSVYSILMDSEKIISKYAKNEELVKALGKEDYDSKFPMYFACTKKRFQTAVKKRRLRNTAARILSKLFMFNDPAHPANQSILKFLSEEDIMYLSPGLFLKISSSFSIVCTEPRKTSPVCFAS